MHLGTLKIIIGSSQFSQLYVYIGALKKLSEEFRVQFKDFRDNEKAFAFFSNPLTADIDNSPIYHCEQFFSSMKLTKTKFRSQLTHTNLKQAQPTEKKAQSTFNADINKLQS